MDSFLIVPVLLAALVVGIRSPEASCGFLLAGATSYFAVTEWLNVPWSSELTAAAYATAALSALVGFVARRPEVRRRLYGVAPILSIVFIFLWLFRRVGEPPVAPGTDPGPYTMVVYGLMAFLSGLLITDEESWDRVVDWTAVFGVLTMAILGFHWLIGTVGRGGGRWLPVRSLTGIVISLELGVGYLALSHAVARRAWLRWLRWPAFFLVLAFGAKLGQRGPFLFLAATVGLDAFLRGKGGLFRKVAFGVVALGFVVSGLIFSSEVAPTRATDIGNYSFESNTDRAALFSAAVTAIGERPILGWGGSIVGRWIDGAPWGYVHVAFLDPLVDTGIAGALLYWSVLLILALGLARKWTKLGGVVGAGASALPIYVLVALEAQVSGAIMACRHLWFMTGVLAFMIDKAVISRRASPAGVSSPRWALGSVRSVPPPRRHQAEPGGVNAVVGGRKPGPLVEEGAAPGRARFATKRARLHPAGEEG